MKKERGGDEAGFENQAKIERMAEMFETLPFEMRQALCWLIENIEFVREIADAPEMTEAELLEMITAAQAKKDPTLLVLVLYKKYMDFFSGK